MSQGPYGPPPGYQPPAPQWAPAPPAKQGAGAGKVLAIGCAAMLVVGMCAAGVGFTLFSKALKGGEPVVEQPFSSGAPFVFEARSRGRDLRVWLDVDAQHTDGFPIQGSLMVTSNGAPIRQVTLNGSLGARCTNPAVGENSSVCLGWRSTQINGQGSAAGRTRLFTIPATATGATLTFGGTVVVGSGTQLRSARILVTD